MLRNDPPECTGIRCTDRFSFIEDGCTSVKQGSVYNIRMPDHPADIGCCPVDFTGTDSIDIFHTPGQGNEMPAIVPQHTFGFSGGSGSIQEIERIGCKQRNTATGSASMKCIPEISLPFRSNAGASGRCTITQTEGLKLHISIADSRSGW